MAEQEAALASLVAEYEQSLGDAQTERDALRAELAEREAELEAQYQQRTAELSDERAAAVRLLEELEAQQEQRQLVLDQILGFYAGARASISEGDYEAAGASLDALRDYLENGPIGSIPDLQRRRQVELFLVDTLEQRLTTLAGSGDGDARSLVESAGLVAEVGELISQAEGSYESGQVERARELYVAALSRIPAVRIGYDRLEEIEAGIEASQSERVTGLIEDGNALYRAGEYDAAVERYGEALGALPAPSDELLARLLDAGYQLRADDSLAELADLRDRLRGVEDLLAAERARVEELAARAEAAEVAAERAGAEAALADRLERTERELGDTRARLEETEEELRTTESLVEELRTALAEQQTGARETAAELAEARGELTAAEQRVAALESRLREQEELVARIERYREAFATRSRETTPGQETSSLELLETKLLILRIVGSDAVRADYPDLYDRLNAYLDALVAEQRADAVSETLNEVATLVDELAARTETNIATIDSLADAYPTLAASDAAATTEDLLSKLREMGR